MKVISGWLALSMVLAYLALAAEEPKEQPKTEETKKVDTTVAMKETTAIKEVPWTTNKSGLKWREKVVGKGTEAKMNLRANCHYTLWLSDKDGKKGKLIQSSKDSKPYQCTIGQNLIKGWSEGMVGMKEGGTRELIIPPAIGYGERGKGSMIPGNATLYFEIEFLNEVKQ